MWVLKKQEEVEMSPWYPRQLPPHSDNEIINHVVSNQTMIITEHSITLMYQLLQGCMLWY